MFPGGLVELLGNDLGRARPPAWADGIELVGRPADSDAVLLVLNGDPSDEIRRIFYEGFAWSLPMAALSLGEPVSEDAIHAKLRSWKTFWVFGTPEEALRIISGRVAAWLSSVSRDGLPYPCGDSLLESFGHIDRGMVDTPSLERSLDVLRRRGFVCLSG